LGLLNRIAIVLNRIAISKPALIRLTVKFRNY
jgi:hypothetical protein